MSPNFRPIVFGLKVRTRGPRPSICVRTFSLFTTTLITNEAQVGEVVEKFRDKYGAGQVKAYYPKPDVAVEVPLA